jgi:hypothetical protein
MLLKKSFGGTNKFLQKRWCGGPKMKCAARAELRSGAAIPREPTTAKKVA